MRRPWRGEGAIGQRHGRCTTHLPRVETGPERSSPTGFTSPAVPLPHRRRGRGVLIKRKFSERVRRFAFHYLKSRKANSYDRVSSCSSPPPPSHQRLIGRPTQSRERGALLLPPPRPPAVRDRRASEMVLSHGVGGGSDESVHSTFASRYVRASLPRHVDRPSPPGGSPPPSRPCCRR